MDPHDRGGLARLRHELRTCVNQILGYSELLREDAESLQPQFVPDIDRIHESGRRVLALVDGLFADSPAGGAAVPGPAAVAPADAASPAAADAARILVVDDDEMNRDMLSRRLARRGFRTELAVDGPSALRRVAAEPFDLVLLDWMMPEMSGLDVLAALRRDYDAATLPVIMATARAEADDVVAALGAGANDYVTKPFDIAVVLARVEAQLAMKRTLDENVRLLRDLEIRNRFIRRTFGRYLTDEIVSSLLDERSGLDLGGEKRRISILMSDLRGFSVIAERLEPHLVVRMLNLYFDAMTGIVMECGGTIDEFVGDAMLVFFGAPGRREDHAAAAVRCAVRMQLAMSDVNESLRALDLPTLEMGIGIHTGDVIVGNVGSARRAKYGAVGSNVNLASRVESFTVGGQILASAHTVEAAGGVAFAGAVRDVRPKGAEAPIRVVEVVGADGDPPLRLDARHAELVELPAPIAVGVVFLEGSDVGGVEHAGELVALSARGARLRLPDDVAAYADVRIRVGAGAADPRAEIFGKVTDRGDGGSAHVTFTSVAPAAGAWIERALATSERSGP
jgi:adenylate cyclase